MRLNVCNYSVTAAIANTAWSTALMVVVLKIAAPERPQQTSSWPPGQTVDQLTDHQLLFICGKVVRCMLLGVSTVCISAGISFLANTRIRFGGTIENSWVECMVFAAKNMQCICNWLPEFLMKAYDPKSMLCFAVRFCLPYWDLASFALIVAESLSTYVSL